MKRWTILSVSAVLWFALIGTVSAAGEAQDEAPAAAQVVLNGQALAFDMPPVNLNGSIFVPFRPLFTQLGYTVDYDDQTKTISAKSDQHDIQMSLGGDLAFVDGKSVPIDNQLRNLDGHTVVGVRFIAALSGKNVEWLADTHTVQLTDNGPNAEQRQAIDSLFDQLLQSENTNDTEAFLALFTEDSPQRPVFEASLPDQQQQTETEILEKTILNFEGATAVVRTEEHTVPTGGDYSFANTSIIEYTLHLDAASGEWLIYQGVPTQIQYDDPEPLLDQGVDVPEPDKSAIEALLKAQNDAYNAADLDALRATIAPFDGLDQTIESLSSLFNQMTMTFTLGKAAVLSYREDHAVIIQEKTIEYKEQGVKVRLLQGNELVKQDGKWLFDSGEYVLKQEQL